jgi:hypothetical protein
MTSATTQKTYTSCLNRLKTEGIFERISTEPAQVVAWITSSASKSGSIDTQNTYINSILYHLRMSAQPETAAAEKVYVEEGKRLQVLRNAKSKKQTLPETKLSALMEWPAVVALDEKAKKELSEEDYLIYSLYTKMPPLRADFVNLGIFVRYAKGRAGNYLVLHKDTKKWRLVLNNYKTSKTFGQQILTLPASVAELIKDNTATLLVMTENNLGKRVTAIFEKLCQKKMSINLLRHSYIKHFLSTKRTILEREALAKKMLHSTGLQEKYDIIHLRDDPPEEAVEELETETTPSSSPEGAPPAQSPPSQP